MTLTVVHGACMEKRLKSKGISSTELALALVILALMMAICAVGVELRHLIR